VYVSRAKHDGVNNNVFINCGGAALGEWQADCLYSGGTVRTVADSQAIDVSGVTDVVAPIDHVFRTARGYASETPWIYYNVGEFKLGEPAIVRLWFASITSGQIGTIEVSVHGQTLQYYPTFPGFSPYFVTGGYFKATHIDFISYPDSNGHIGIGIGPGTLSSTMFINAIEIRQAVYDVVTIGDSISQIEEDMFTFSLAKKTTIADLEKISIAAPMLYGQPSINGFDALLPECDEVTLTVKEPLGTAVAQRRAACSNEICGIEGVEAPPVVVDPPVPVKLEESFASMWWVSMAGNDTRTPAAAFADLAAGADALCRAEWAAWDARAQDPRYSLALTGQWSAGAPGSEGYTSSSLVWLLGNKMDINGAIITTVAATKEIEGQDMHSSRAFGSSVMYFTWEIDVYITEPAP
jgi:hypothetical protein